MTVRTAAARRLALIALALAALMLSSSVIAVALTDRPVYVFGAYDGNQAPDKIAHAMKTGPQARGWTGQIGMAGRPFVNPRPFYSPYWANKPGRRFI